MGVRDQQYFSCSLRFFFSTDRCLSESESKNVTLTVRDHRNLLVSLLWRHTASAFGLPRERPLWSASTGGRRVQPGRCRFCRFDPTVQLLRQRVRRHLLMTAVRGGAAVVDQRFQGCLCFGGVEGEIGEDTGNRRGLWLLLMKKKYKDLDLTEI